MKSKLENLFKQMLTCKTPIQTCDVVELIMTILAELDSSSDTFKNLKNKLTFTEYNSLLNTLSMTLVTSVYAMSLDDKDINSILNNLDSEFDVKLFMKRHNEA